jgi:hypothetical protein
MLQEARILAGRLGAAQIGWTSPNTAEVLDAAKHAGFILEWDAKLWVFEHR